MPDQADKLRQLIADSRPTVCANVVWPPTVVVTGGKGGVGATTVALNLAAALTCAGHRTVLVDAAPHADAAPLAGIDTSEGRCIADVVAGFCDAADALQRGPAGILLLAGRWAPEESPDRSPDALELLRTQLGTLKSHADVLVVDSGSGINSWTRPLWQQAGLVLMVTTPDDVAVMDSYAALKRGAVHGLSAEIRVTVNQCASDTAAADAERRFATACRRFLGRGIGKAPRLPRDDAPHDAGIQIQMPRAWETPSSAFGRSVHQLARFVADVLSQHKVGSRHSSELVRC